MSAATGRYFDRVRDTATAVSPTTVTLANAPPATFQAVGAAYANGDVVPTYLIQDATNWEVSYGAFNTVGPALARAAVPLASSNGGAQVVAFSGVINIATVAPAAQTNQWLFGVPSGNMRTNLLASNVANNNFAVSTVFYVPILIPTWFSSVIMNFCPTTLSGNASSRMDLGLMTNLNGQPNTRLAQVTGINSSNTGPLVVNTNNVTASMPMPSPQPPGIYWAAFVIRVASGNFKTVTAAGSGLGGRFVMGTSTTVSLDDTNAWTQASGTIPATASGLSTNTTNAPFLGVTPAL